jgi:hypothetical protein
MLDSEISIQSVSWVRIWAHTMTMLSGGYGHPINLIGEQRAKIRHNAPYAGSTTFRLTWRAVGPLLRQLEDGNVMKRING